MRENIKNVDSKELMSWDDHAQQNKSEKVKKHMTFKYDI